MKKAIVILMLLVVSLTILTGCGSSESESKGGQQQRISDQDSENKGDVKDTNSKSGLPKPPQFP